MKFNPPREWFGAKKVGWGISPHTWEGWTILVIGVIAIVSVSTTVFG